MNKKLVSRRLLLFTICMTLMMVLGACTRKMKVKFDFDSSNYVTKIPEYKGIEYTPDNREVTEENIDSYIRSVTAKDTIWMDFTDKKVELGDKLIISFSASDAETGDYLTGFSTSENYTIVLGTGTLSKKFENFEEQLVGLIPGFSKNMTCKVLPEESSSMQEGYLDYVGKEIKFTVTVIDAFRGTVPSLTPAYVEKITENKLHSEAEYRLWVKRSLQKTLDEEKYSIRYREIMDQLITQVEVSSYPQAVLEEKKQQTFDSMNLYSAFLNMEPEEYCQKNYGCSIEDYCKNSLRTEMLLQEVIKREKLTLTRREYEKSLESYAEKYGYQTVDELLEAQTEENVAKAMLLQKAIDVIVDSSVPKKE